MASKERPGKELYTISKDFINKYLSGFEKERQLKDVEVMHLLEEGIHILELKVEFLATGEYNSEFSQNENHEKAIEYFQTLPGINPRDSKLPITLGLALRIIEERENKEQALKDLNKIRDIYSKYLSEIGNFIRGLPRYPPRLAEINDPIRAKAMGFINRVKNVLQEKIKNDEEYKILMKRKNAGELVNNLIKENRSYEEILAKRDREYSLEALKWGMTEEGREFYESLAKENPNAFTEMWDEFKNYIEQSDKEKTKRESDKDN
ncbi:MAG: hypothetical protein ACFFCI_06970 [Promethearchaeota archaeon]